MGLFSISLFLKKKPIQVEQICFNFILIRLGNQNFQKKKKIVKNKKENQIFEITSLFIVDNSALS